MFKVGDEVVLNCDMVEEMDKFQIEKYSKYIFTIKSIDLNSSLPYVLITEKDFAEYHCKEYELKFCPKKLNEQKLKKVLKL